MENEEEDRKKFMAIANHCILVNKYRLVGERENINSGDRNKKPVCTALQLLFLIHDINTVCEMRYEKCAWRIDIVR